MNLKYVQQIRVTMESESTEVLLKIWKENDRERYCEEKFEAIKQLLIERGATLPLQKKHELKETTSPLQKHAWPGKLYIILNYVFAAFYFIAILSAILIPPLVGTSSIVQIGYAEWLLILLSLMPVILIISIARGVSRFKQWAWWAAMAHIIAMLSSALIVIFSPIGKNIPLQLVIAIVFIVLGIMWAIYFWSRRQDFRKRKTIPT